MKDSKLVIDNIEKVITLCGDHIEMLSVYMSRRPIPENFIDDKIRELTALKEKWEKTLDYVSEYGMEEDGEYSYPQLSYNGSYAFVILAGILNKLRFEFERYKLLEDYVKFQETFNHSISPQIFNINKFKKDIDNR